MHVLCLLGGLHDLSGHSSILQSLSYPYSCLRRVVGWMGVIKAIRYALGQSRRLKSESGKWKRPHCQHIKTQGAKLRSQAKISKWGMNRYLPHLYQILLNLRTTEAVTRVPICMFFMPCSSASQGIWTLDCPEYPFDILQRVPSFPNFKLL